MNSRNRGASLIEDQVAELLKSRGLTISVAEACTAGMIATRLTSVAGSSSYFVGGVLAYANEVKEQILRVPKEMMIRDGSVAEATALAMARGVKKLLGTDLAVAATGVMGPGGATPAKPVGLFFLAVAGPGDSETCRCYLFRGDRSQNREEASEEALKLVREVVLASPEESRPR
jgi:nicotinamide-nucleotide amidase